MFWFERLTKYLSMVVVFVGAISVILMMLHITLDVFLRPFHSFSIPATLTMVTKYYMIALTLLPLAWVEKNQSMIVVEVFSTIYQGSLLRFNRFCVNGASVFLYGILAKATWEQAVDQFQAGTYVASLNIPIPIWPAFYILPISFSLAALVCFIRIFHPEIRHSSV